MARSAAAWRFVNTDASVCASWRVKIAGAPLQEAHGFRGRLDLHFEGCRGQRFRCPLLGGAMNCGLEGDAKRITRQAMNGGRIVLVPPAWAV